VLSLKPLELTYSIRPLDVDGVSDQSTLETDNLEEALLKLQTLSHGAYNKWVIVATSHDEEG